MSNQSRHSLTLLDERLGGTTRDFSWRNMLGQLETFLIWLCNWLVF